MKMIKSASLYTLLDMYNVGMVMDAFFYNFLFFKSDIWNHI